MELHVHTYRKCCEQVYHAKCLRIAKFDSFTIVLAAKIELTLKHGTGMKYLFYLMKFTFLFVSFPLFVLSLHVIIYRICTIITRIGNKNI